MEIPRRGKSSYEDYSGALAISRTQPAEDELHTGELAKAEVGSYCELEWRRDERVNSHSALDTLGRDRYTIFIDLTMKTRFIALLLATAFTLSVSAAEGGKRVSLTDGKTFAGWEGDTNKTWRIEAGAFVGGSLTEKVPHNEFLCTQKEYKNFDLRLKVKLVGKEGFINGGVQFRSKRIPNHFEVIGYQADMGDPKYWGCLYDESRRKKMLVEANKEDVDKVLKRNEWNDYRVRCEGKHIQIFLNGFKTVDYTEAEEGIEETGSIAVQIHGGATAEASYKEITIEELP